MVSVSIRGSGDIYGSLRVVSEWFQSVLKGFRAFHGISGEFQCSICKFKKHFRGSQWNFKGLQAVLRELQKGSKNSDDVV